MITKDPNEYGTQLEYRMRGSQEIKNHTMWGTEHGQLIQAYAKTFNLFKLADYHRFVPVSRNQK